jgi:hypothetical protein
MKPAQLAIALVALILPGPLLGEVAPRWDECAGPQGDYNDSQWSDPSGNCRVDPTWWQLADAAIAVQAFESVCDDEAQVFSASQNQIWEWTGNWQGWMASTHTGTGDIAFHWDHFESSWLWAHELAHSRGMNEQQAVDRANECLTISGETPRP